MKIRFPIVATMIVAAAVVVMVALGVWQLQRKGEKEALIALYAANRAKSEISYPALGPVSDMSMFRKSTVTCLKVVRWQASAGKDAQGRSGIRYIAEGPGILVLAGVADRPDLTPAWTGGAVTGLIVTEPDKRSLLQKALGSDVVLRPMLIATSSVEGLRAPSQPKPEDVANNHLAYAVQWFLFAAAAAIIYLLALRKRQAG
jgi:cytochrome oxidase assembly protein ShyY1